MARSRAKRNEHGKVQQHFSLSAAACTLDLSEIARMSEEEAYQAYRRLRWPETDGQPVCPHADCRCDAVYELKSRPRYFKCKRCSRQFTVTTGTDFAYRKLPFQKILQAIAKFAMPAKGCCAINLRLELCVAYKTAWRLAHKLRAAMATDLEESLLHGEVEIDGAEFGGHLRPKNVKKRRNDLRKFPWRSKDKQIVVVMRERGGRTRTVVVDRETDALPTIRKLVGKGAKVFADSAACWNSLAASFEMGRINHKEAYWTPEASTNCAECFFSVLRRSAFGIYHRISGKHLGAYSLEATWRLDRRHLDTRARYETLARAALSAPPSHFGRLRGAA